MFSKRVRPAKTESQESWPAPSITQEAWEEGRGEDEYYDELDRATLNTHAPSDEAAPDQSQKSRRCRRGCMVCGCVSFILLVIIPSFWALFVHYFIPGLIQRQLDKTSVTSGQTTLSAPLGDTLGDLSILVATAVHLNYRPFMPATIEATNMSFAFCPPAGSAIDNFTTCDLSQAIFGTMLMPEINVYTNKDSVTPVRSRFFISNDLKFKYFTGELLDADSVAVQVNATISVYIDVWGIYRQKVPDVLFNKTLRFNGLQGLSGVYADRLDFAPGDRQSNDMPYFNMTCNFQNVGNTNISDMGDVRFEMFGYGPWRNETGIPTSLIGDSIAYDLSFPPGWTKVRALGPVWHHASHLDYRGVERLVSDYINGVNATISALCTSNACCFEQKEDCCVPASSYLLFAWSLEATPISVTVKAPTGGFALFPEAVLSELPRPDHPQQNISVRWAVSNPFEAPFALIAMDVLVEYDNNVVAVFSQEVVRSEPSPPLVYVSSYGQSVFTSQRALHLPPYPPGSTNQAAQLAWVAQLATKGAAASQLSGKFRYTMSALQNIAVSYDRHQLHVLTSSVTSQR